MKMLSKKALALLSAGTLLTGTAAVYAAQLPAQLPTGKIVPPSTSSQEEPQLSLVVYSYALTADRFEIHGNSVFSNGIYQSRLSTYSATITCESDSGTTFVYDGPISGDPRYFDFSTPVAMKPGDRLHVSIRATAETCYGYAYYGKVYAQAEFDFTL